MARGDPVEVVYYRSQRKVCVHGMDCSDMRFYMNGGVPLLCKHKRTMSPYGETEVKLFVNSRGKSRMKKAAEYVEDHPYLWTMRSSEMLI